MKNNTITALENTWLKKSTKMASELLDNKKHYIEQGTTLDFITIFGVIHNHSNIKLAYEQGVWYIYNPHWTIKKTKREEKIYEKAINFMLQWEGGYVNHPNDKGGATNKGVTTATYNAYRDSKNLSRQSVRYITDAEVAEIYRTRYWDASKCNVIAERSGNLAIAHFDWAVNAGVSRAVSTLQGCLETTPDGIWGKITQYAWETCNPSEVLNCYLQRREYLYRVWGQGSQAVFLTGWINRLNSLKQELA